MNGRRILCGICLSFVVAGCAERVPATSLPLSPTATMPALPEPDVPPADRAQAAARAFSMTLKSTLSQQIAQGGPAAAVGFCREAAPEIARRVAAEYGVRIGRVPVPGRQRNPANTPAAWQVAILADFQRSVAAGGKADEQWRMQTAHLPQNVSLRMMRGIAVEPVCLLCHGKMPAPDAAQAIAGYYPQDTANGFEAGDLRGALWVEVPAITLKE